MHQIVILRKYFILLFAFIIIGCSSIPKQKITYCNKPSDKFCSHKVRSGETLWRISDYYGISIEEIVKVNNISNEDNLQAGQVLRIPLYKKKEKASFKNFEWPIKGEIISYYRQNLIGSAKDGINIKPSDTLVVSASREGIVEFSQPLKGYGYTVIIKHTKGYATLYSNLSSAFVEENDIVKTSQPIGKVGKSIRANEPYLYFEIRKQDKPLNPLYYLP